jgi:hypothetical protein
MSDILDYNTEIIENALELSQENAEAADEAASDAMQAASGFSFFDQAYPSWTPGAVEPAVYIPTTAQETDPFWRYESTKQELTQWLADLFTTFFTTYYPLATDAFDEGMAWVTNTITNGGTGIPAAVEDQIWQRDRDRILRSSLQAQNSAYADFAARGFSLPPGSLTAQLEKIRTEGLLKLAEVSRDAAIKQAEIEIENIRFAVKLAIDTRLKAIEVACDYIKAMALGPEIATKLVDKTQDAQARLIAATADYYRARLARDELSLKAWATLMEQKGKDGSTNITGWNQGIDAKVRAAVGAADSYGKVASAALSALTSIVSVSTQAFEE